MGGEGAPEIVTVRWGGLLVVSVMLAAVSARASDVVIDDTTAKRDPGEISLLYVTGIGWGVSAGVALDGLANSGNAYAGANPFVLAVVCPLTGSVLGAGVGFGVDQAFHKRPGAAQVVTTSMLLGLGEGIALDEYFSNRSQTSFHTYTKDAAWVFLGPAVGLATGLAVDALVHTTPGRAAWVETTGLFTGFMAASIVGAAHSSFGREGNRDVGLAWAIGGAAGIAGGVASARWLSPGSLRVHLVDLGWITGMVAPALACIDHCSPEDTFLAMAVGGAVGFAGAFLATGWMPRHIRGHDLPPVAPVVTPTDHGGLTVGLAGML